MNQAVDLPSSVTQALQANTTVRSAQAALQQARALRDVSSARLAPTVSAAKKMPSVKAVKMAPKNDPMNLSTPYPAGADPVSANAGNHCRGSGSARATPHNRPPPARVLYTRDAAEVKTMA